jgi:hypothetical protein
LIVRIQELLYERIMWISVISSTSHQLCGPRVRGNPYKIQPPKSFAIWFIAPFEDVDLTE